MNKKIQILRGLAIIAVVMIHTNISGLAGVITRPFINFAVATFIFVSGYLTKLIIVDIKSFYKKRLLRVLVPYTIWSIIYTVCSGNYKDFIANFLTGRCCGIYYYIFVYSIFVLLTPLINKMILSKHMWIGWAITPISLLFTRYIVALTGISLPDGLQSFLFTNWFVFYYLGLCLGNKKIILDISTARAVVVLILSILLSMFEGALWFTFGNYDMATTQLRFTSMLTSLSSILLMFKYLNLNVEKTCKSKMSDLFEKGLTCIGDSSFGIYLSHFLIIAILGKLPLVSHFPFPLSSVVVIIISTSCVLIGKKILTTKFSWALGL